MKNRQDMLYRVFFIGLLFLSLFYLQKTMDSYAVRIINLCGIYIILALGLNLINGFTGLFSLGHAGFMAIGAYTSAILTMPENVKVVNFFMKPMNGFLVEANAPFVVALVIAMIVSGLIALLIGIPALRLRDDYLAIATLGFSEIIRVVFTNTYSVTNGALGLKMIPTFTNIWWSWGSAVLVILFMFSFSKSSFGRAVKAIREDEVAAEAMGIDLFKTKLLAFVIGSAFAGLGGALLGNLIGTIDPALFRFTLTFNILLIVVIGGMGSISGSVIAAVIVTVMMEALRFLDESVKIGGYIIEGIPGLRMVVFSLILMIVVIFYSEGLMGKKELSIDSLKEFGKSVKTRKIHHRAQQKDVKKNA